MLLLRYYILIPNSMDATCYFFKLLGSSISCFLKFHEDVLRYRWCVGQGAGLSADPVSLETSLPHSGKFSWVISLIIYFFIFNPPFQFLNLLLHLGRFLWYFLPALLPHTETLRFQLFLTYLVNIIYFLASKIFCWFLWSVLFLFPIPFLLMGLWF